MNKLSLEKIKYYWAIGFGLGFVKYAPGTFGTLLAFLLYWLADFLPLALHVFVWVLLLILSLISSRDTAKLLGVKDPKIIVCDEFISFWLILIIVPTELFLIAFLLFRIFDIFKPWPVSFFDKNNSEWSIVLDDIAAAFYVLLIYFLAAHLVSAF